MVDKMEQMRRRQARRQPRRVAVNTKAVIAKAREVDRAWSAYINSTSPVAQAKAMTALNEAVEELRKVIPD